MANELKLENPLSSDRKPVKVGNDSTGILLADNEVYIENDANVGGDLTVNGSITTETGTNILDGTTSIRTPETHEVGIYLSPTGLISIGEPAIGTGAIAALGYGLTNQSKLVLYSRQDVGDYLQISTTTNGATSIFTVDDDGTNANLSIDVDGSLTLNSSTGAFIAENSGTEFSAANSAYAGMILGYRMIGEDASSATYALTTSMAVPHPDMTVRFIAPPSGSVEIMVQAYVDQTTTRRSITFGLSDNATYSSIGNSYEQKVMATEDRENDTVVQNHWTITGLTAGDTYNYWFGAKTSGTVATLGWGGTSASEYPDFIMKVTALPTAVTNYVEYD